MSILNPINPINLTTMAFDVSLLSVYVAENQDVLLSKAVLGAETLGIITVQPGVKYKERIHLLSTTPSIQAGDCSFSANGDVKFTQREITAPGLKVNMEFCDRDFIGKYAQWQVNYTAGRETLPFEERITAEITKSVSRKVEDYIWQGNSGLGVNGIMSFLSEMTDFSTGASIGAGDWSSVTSVSGAYSAIKAVYGAIPVESLDKAVIFVSEGTYRKFVQELVAANLYHFEPEYTTERKAYLPGTSTMIKAVPGLNTFQNGKAIVAANPELLFWGCDLEDGQEIFDLWYSKDAQTFRLAIKFNGGAQIAFPEDVVIGALA